MTLSLFQKYELRKTRFAPGNIWRDKGSHTVIKLQIIDPSEIDGADHVHRFYYQEGRSVIFRILESEDSNYHPPLGRGNLASWGEEYMELNYEVVFDE
jgi:hypothetical protein